MARIFYIGDEATAAGYRLAGADVRVPAPSEVADAFRHAREAEPDLILLSSGITDQLPPEELEAAVLGDAPLVVVVPDVYGRSEAPDVARQVRLALGIEP